MLTTYAARLFLGFVLLFAGTAVAQDASTTDVTIGGTPWWVPIVLGIFTLMSSIVTGVLLPSWKRKLEAQTATEKADGKKSLMTTVAVKVEHFAELVQADIDATMAPAIAEALKDGKITDEEIASLRSLALTRMKLLLGTAGLAELKLVMGLADDSAVNQYLLGMVEKTIDVVNSKAKAQTVTATATASSP